MEKNEDGTSGWVGTPGVFFVLGDRSTFFALLRFRVMDLLKACDEMKGFIETAQKLVDAWDADPDNYSQLEEGLSALKAELEKFKDEKGDLSSLSPQRICGEVVGFEGVTPFSRPHLGKWGTPVFA